MIAQKERIGHALESACMLRTGDQRQVRCRSQRNEDVIVWQLHLTPLGKAHPNCALRHVQAFNRSFDESDPAQTRADRLCAMPELQHSRACLEQQRTQKEEIVATNESDLDIQPMTEKSIEVSRRGKSAYPAAKDDDSGRCSRVRMGLCHIRSGIMCISSWS